MSIKRCISVSLAVCLYDQINEVETVSIKRCVSVSVVVCLYDQIDEVASVHSEVCISISGGLFIRPD